MSNSLDDILQGAPPPAPPEQEPPPPPPEAEPAPAEAPPAEPADDIPATPDGMVDRRVMERARRDYKDRAARAEAERDAIRKEFEDAKRLLEEMRKPAPPPPEPQPQYQPLTAEEVTRDPSLLLGRMQEAILNERLNTSEMLLRNSIGAEKVDAAVAEFKAAAQTDPTLMGRLYSQPDPYGWLVKEVERRRTLAEIGDDPAAYRERLRAEAVAEARAKWEEEAGMVPFPGAAPVQPAPARAPSLANARAAMPRSAPVSTGPTPMSDILGGR